METVAASPESEPAALKSVCVSSKSGSASSGSIEVSRKGGCESRESCYVSPETQIVSPGSLWESRERAGESGWAGWTATRWGPEGQRSSNKILRLQKLSGMAGLQSGTRIVQPLLSWPKNRIYWRTGLVRKYCLSVGRRNLKNDHWSWKRVGWN